MLDYIVGEFEDHPDARKNSYGAWKFIVGHRDEALVLHAGVYRPLDGDEAIKHPQIAERNGFRLLDVLGGGEIYYMIDDATFMGSSTNYGGVPNSVLEGFVPQLFEAMESYNIGVLKMHMKPEEVKEKSKGKILGMGFSFEPKPKEHKRDAA